jgi:hypothetical protein
MQDLITDSQQLGIPTGFCPVLPILNPLNVFCFMRQSYYVTQTSLKLLCFSFPSAKITGVPTMPNPLHVLYREENDMISCPFCAVSTEPF